MTSDSHAGNPPALPSACKSPPASGDHTPRIQHSLCYDLFFGSVSSEPVGSAGDAGFFVAVVWTELKVLWISFCLEIRWPRAHLQFKGFCYFRERKRRLWIKNKSPAVKKSWQGVWSWVFAEFNSYVTVQKPNRGVGRLSGAIKTWKCAAFCFHNVALREQSGRYSYLILDALIHCRSCSTVR